MTRTAVSPNKIGLYTQPTFVPGMTWGLGNAAAYQPGPGGPVPDMRGTMIPPPNPIYGRVGSMANWRAFGPPVGVYRPWGLVGSFNNAWAPAVPQLFVPGWIKPAPSPTSGF